MYVDPEEIFQGRILVTVPHMDDEVLGCGGTIARLRNKEQVHVVYVSDGAGSPPEMIGQRSNSSYPDIRKIRIEEARIALQALGVPLENVYFLGFPGDRLGEYLEEIRLSLGKIFGEVNPNHVFTPFRYDRHPDHIAVNRVTTELVRSKNSSANLFEYFIYYRWRFLPQGDIRKYIGSSYLIFIDIKSQTAQKRKALECFVSQVTKFYSWQARPVLSANLLEEFSQGPEVFLQWDGSLSEREIFVGMRTWIRLAHKVEPFVKMKKDQTLEFLYQTIRRGKMQCKKRAE